MAKQVINIGTTPNDGTGDTIRESFNKTNQNFTELYDGQGGGGIPEAPEDGKTYGRKDADWSEVTSGSGIPEAPEDGKTYGRKDANWSEVTSGSGIPEAPNDGQQYGRQSEAWSVITGGGTIPESVRRQGNNLVFDFMMGAIYNSEVGDTQTGNITLDGTGALIGAICSVYNDGSAEPTVTPPPIVKGGIFLDNRINVYVFMWDGTNFIQNIQNQPVLQQLQTPTLSLSNATATFLDYGGITYDLAATNSIMEISDDNINFVVVDSGDYSSGDASGTITKYGQGGAALVIGSTYWVRVRSSSYGYETSEYAVDSSTVLAVFSNDYSGDFSDVNARVNSDARVQNLEFSNGGSDLPFSISFWIKTPQVSSVENIGGYYNSAFDALYFINHQPTGGNVANSCKMNVYDNTGDRISLSSTAIPVDTWTFVTFTYSGNKLVSGLNVYINGLLDAGTTESAGIYDGMRDAISNSRYVLGQHFSGANAFVGLMDEFSIWSVEFDATMVSDLYNGGTPFDYLSHSQAGALEIWTRFENSVLDSSGNNVSCSQTFVGYDNADKP